MAKDKDPLTDSECAANGEVQYWCLTHGQALATCANGRLKQVKLAREMEARTMASARAREKQANETREEINTLKAKEPPRA